MKERQHRLQSEVWQRPGHKEKMQNIMLNVMSDPIVIEKLRKIHEDPVYKENVEQECEKFVNYKH